MDLLSACWNSAGFLALCMPEGLVCVHVFVRRRIYLLVIHHASVKNGVDSFFFFYAEKDSASLSRQIYTVQHLLCNFANKAFAPDWQDT